MNLHLPRLAISVPRILQMDGEMLSLKSSWKSQGTRAFSHRHAPPPLSP